MATYSSHRLIMGKVEICNFFLSQWRYLGIFYAPNFEKVGSILVSDCAFVRSSVLPSVQKKIQARVLKFYIWIPRQKKLTRIFFLSELSPFAELCPF